MKRMSTYHKLAQKRLPKEPSYPTHCARCGERFSPADIDHDLAEVADGIIHASCMRPGEEIA